MVVSREPLPTRVDATSPLLSAYVDALDAGLSALSLTLEPAARGAIDGHARLLLAWTQAINLTAIRDPAAIAVRHVADSLSALGELRRRGIDRFVDLGSGGGFPGLPLAVALPADRALLIDSVGKKVRFLATVVAAVGLDTRVAAESVRSESLAAGPTDRERWQAVTARAVAPLAELIELALPLLRPGGILVAWKRADATGGPGLAEELAAGRRALASIDREGRLDVRPANDAVAELAGHRLVVVERGRDSIAGTWPRDPAARRRLPW